MTPFARLRLPLALLFASCLSALAEPVLLLEREGGTVPVSELPNWKPGLGKEHFQLQADLSELDGLAYWWPAYKIEHSTGQQRDKWPEVDARMSLSLDINNPRFAGETKTPNELAEIWQGAQGKDELMLAAWILGGKVIKVIPADTIRRANGDLVVLKLYSNLSEAELAGYPVLLLWSQGHFVPAAPHRMKAEFADAFRAAIKDDGATLGRLLDAGLSADLRDDEGDSLVKYAAGAGAENALAVLKAHKARFKEKGEPKVSSIEFAARRGRTGAVRFLVANGVSASGRDRSFDSPLYCASVNGHVETVKALLALKADIEEQTHLNQTAIVGALNEGYTDVSEVLLKSGANFDFASDNNRKVFLSVCREGNFAMARFHMAHGASAKQRMDGLYPLTEAARKGSAAMANFLIKAGAHLDVQDTMDRTALIEACLAGNEPYALALLAAGAKSSQANESGTTALHAAIFRQEHEVVKALLAAGAPVGAKNRNGLTPFDTAVIIGAWECVAPFLKAGARIDLKSPLFLEELQSILRGDQPDLLAQLLQAGLPVDFKTPGGWSLRRLAALAKATRCATVLDEAGAKLDEASPVPIVKGAELDAGFKFLSGNAPRDPRPEELAEKGASMKVRALVDGSGQVRFVMIDECADSLLCVGLSGTVDSWRFTPPLKDGKPAAVWVKQLVKFPSAEERYAARPVADVLPCPIRQVRPVYPFEERRRGAMAEVFLTFTVDEKGSVINARVVRTSGEAFNQPALDCVKKWKFKPGTAKGVPVPVELSVPIAFSISD